MKPYERVERRLYPSWRERFQRHCSDRRVHWFSTWREKCDFLSFLFLASSSLFGWPYVLASSVIASSLRARRSDREAWIDESEGHDPKEWSPGFRWLVRGAVLGTIGFSLPMGLLVLGSGVPGQVRGLVAGAVPLLPLFILWVAMRNGRGRGLPHADTQGALAYGQPGSSAGPGRPMQALGALMDAFAAGNSLSTVGVSVLAAIEWDDMKFATWTVVSLFLAINVAQILAVGLMTHTLDESERAVSDSAREHAKDLLRAKQQRGKSG